MGIAARIASGLVGGHLLEVERRENDWRFRFADDAWLRVECHWRIVMQGRIAFGDTDHDQQFGLPEPVDGADLSNRLLLGKSVQGVAIRDDTGDVTIEFSDHTAVEILNISSGYEGWEYGDRTGLYVVAMGGGELAVWGG